MDEEDSQKRDDADETSQTTLESLRNVPAENAECVPSSQQKTRPTAGGVSMDLEKRREENDTNERTSSESSNPDVAEVDGPENASRKRKLSSSEHMEDSERKLQKGLLGEAVSLVDGAVKKEGVTSCPGGDIFNSNLMCPHCDFKCADGAVLKIHWENKHAEEVPAALPENKPSSEASSVSYSVGNISNDLKGKTCNQLFLSCSDREKHTTESHSRQSKEQTCPRCSCAAHHSSALHTHIQQDGEQSRIFCCDLCGFRSVEENLLTSHFLGKTHVRRQNLAARGGFVQMLTKKSFNKQQPTAVRERTVRMKPGTNKLRTRPADKKGLSNVCSVLKGSKESLSKQNDGAEVVEVVPSTNAASEKPTAVAKEMLLASSVEENHQIPTGMLAMPGPSKSILPQSEHSVATKKLVSSSNMTRRFDRLEHKRNFVFLRTSFGRSSSFRLKRQVKRRYNLLGSSRKGRCDPQSEHVKRISRTQLKAGDARPTWHAELEARDKNQTASTSEIQDLTLDRSHTLPSSTMDTKNSQIKLTDDHSVPHTCSYCGTVFQNIKSLESHVVKLHTKRIQFLCETCSYSSLVKEDVQQHCQDSKHQVGGCRFSCQLCSFMCLNVINLQSHMSAEHGMSHSCPSCLLFFLTEEELVNHRRNEQHDEPAAPLSDRDLTLQVVTYAALESNNGPKHAKDMEVSMKEKTPDPSFSNHRNEAKHSVLNKTQFQCKKCFYKTRSSTVLTRHIKLRHAQEYHFLCKACNLYSLSKEGMEKHIKRSKHLENARKNNIGLRFEDCIEKVCVGVGGMRTVMEPSISGSGNTDLGKEIVHVSSSTGENISRNKVLVPADERTGDSELVLATAPRRGRPKGIISRTCPHCGLLASSVTNLTVHIRRKHSHQYSYLCKLCNYYTVTKGDMERHCATKKHRSRVEIEGLGKQSSEIIVGPEGGNFESGGRKVNSPTTVLHEPVDDDSHASDVENPVVENREDGPGNSGVKAENAYQLPDLEHAQNSLSIKQGLFLEAARDPQDGDLCLQRRAVGASDNKCIHCDFVAHSASSLELHVKRKHTKQFEYYCMACDYYAVTRREMIRHAATEKHKIRRETYVCSSGEEAETGNIVKEATALSQEECHRGPTELETGLDDTKCAKDEAEDDHRSKSLTEGSGLDETASPEMPQDGHSQNTVEAELEGEAKNGGKSNFCEVLQQVPQKDQVAALHKEVSVNEAGAQRDLQESGRAQGLPHSDNECPAGNQEGSGDTNVNPGTGEESLEASGENLGVECRNTDVLEEIHLKEKNPPGLTLTETSSAVEQSNVAENTGETVQNTHRLEGDRSFEEEPTGEEEEALMEAQHEAEVTINNSVWEADGSTAEGMQGSRNEALGTVTSADDKGKTLPNFGKFDSSIVRLKSHQDGEATEQGAEGQVPAGGQGGELAAKADAWPSGARKRKPEGISPGESTRIRCDDCGFLADGLSGLNVHIAMKHPSKEKHFHCLLCGKSFYTESNLHQHLASAGHMRNEQASVEELPEGGATFKCVKCTEPFDSEQNLFLHIKEQHEELLREVNKYIVEDTEQINREREENQGNVCKYCGKLCRSSNSMAFLAHIRTHTGSKPFKCKICHFATAQLGDARNHVKRHLGMREYKCHVCG
ncbi:ZN407 protein, partial [Nothoprocta pentlandii]|nr:ZN407 protein [Nothoprocta pentlandii]